MKEKLGGNIMTKIIELRSEKYYCLIEDNNADGKVKGTKKCGINWRLKFEFRKIYLQSYKIKLRLQEMLNSETHDMFKEEVNKIVLRSNDDSILQTFYEIVSCPYSANAGKVCKVELLQYLW